MKTEAGLCTRAMRPVSALILEVRQLRRKNLINRERCRMAASVRLAIPAIPLSIACCLLGTLRSPGQSPGTAKAHWPFAAENAVIGSPAIDANGTIYVTAGDARLTHNGKLYAIDPTTGQSKPGWPIQLGNSQSYNNEPLSSPVIANNGTLYVASTDQNLYNINPDGTENWRLQIFSVPHAPNPVGSSVALALDGTVYVTYDDEPKLYAVNPAGNSGSGSIKWTFDLSELPSQYFAQFIDSCPTVGPDGKVYFYASGYYHGQGGAFTTALIAIDCSGNYKWLVDLGFDEDLDEFQCNPVVGTDGTIYVPYGDSASGLAAFNPDGSPKWNNGGGVPLPFQAGGTIRSSPAIGTNGTLYFGADDGHLYAVNQNGALKWKFPNDANSLPPITSSPAVGSDGTVYYGSTDGHLYAVRDNGTAGAQEFIFPSSGQFGSIVSSPVIGSDNAVYFGSEDNQVYAVFGYATLASSGWPMFRKNISHTGSQDSSASPCNTGCNYSISLSPARICREVGDTHTVTASVLNSAGQPAQGVTIHFSVVAGPNVGKQSSPDPTTDANGHASWNYVGNGGTGQDVIMATVVGSSCAATAYCDWSSGLPVVSIVATDPTATEPSDPCGYGLDTGTFTVTRSGGDTTQPLTITASLNGSADWSADYSFGWDANSGSVQVQGNQVSITFDANVTSLAITVIPAFDGNPDGPETVVLSIDPQSDCSYKPGSPAQATVVINDPTSGPHPVRITVLLPNGSPSPGNQISVSETDSQSVTLRFSRDCTQSFDSILLSFTGTAIYGVDYTIDSNPNYIDSLKQVQIPTGQSSMDIVLRPVPDTRVEGNETAIVTILPDPNNTYTVGTPASGTVTIEDIDSTVYPPPSQRWQLTVLGGYDAHDVNGLGQVVGEENWIASPGVSGFLWSNGTKYDLPPLYWMYPDQNFSAVFGVNNSGIAVGVWSGGTRNSPTSPNPTFWDEGYFDGETVYLQTLPQISGGSRTVQDAARDISDAGIIVGQEGGLFGNVHATAWVPSGYESYPAATDLQDLSGGGLNSYANAINEAGQVVGKSDNGVGGVHAFRSDFSSGVPTALTAANDMGTLTANDTDPSEGRDINETGELAGGSQVSGGQYHAMYKAGKTGKDIGWFDLGLLPAGSGTPYDSVGNWSQANGINNHGVIVGQSTVYIRPVPWSRQLVYRAFVLSNNGNAGSQPLTDLTSQTDVYQNGWHTAASQGWAIINAERINDSNWIVGTAQNGSAVYAVLLTPR